MAWRDRLLPASYRGVGFFVESDSLAGGRRVALHEYPLRDTPFSEDLGRRARAYQLEAVLVGPDYDRAVARLTTALEAAGAGMLTHPTHGLVSVVVVGFRVRLSTAEGGMARVTMDLAEAGENAFPLSLLDSLGGVFSAVRDLVAAAQSVVALAYTIARLPSLVLEAGRALLAGFLAPLEGLAASLGMSDADRARYSAGLGLATRDLDSIAASPALVGALIADQITPLRTLAGAPWPAYRTLSTLTGWGADLPQVPTTTPARVAQASNQGVIVAAVRDIALAHACQAALSAVAAAQDGTTMAALEAGIPATSGEIAALRTTLLGAIDLRQADAPDSLYQAWSSLRVAVARDLADRVLVAPTLRTLVPAVTEAALVIAYRIHGDAARDAELVRRNHIRDRKSVV